MANELKYPLTTKQVMCHNGKDVYHFVTVEPNQVCTTGQPVMEMFDTKASLSLRADIMNLKGANKMDYEIFLNPEMNVAAGEVI